MDKSLSKYERKLGWNEAKHVISDGENFKYGSVLIAIQKSDEWRLRINLKKSVKPAYKRNHIKRILREVYRTSKPKVKTPYKVVFTVMDNFPGLDFNSFKEKYLTYFNE